MTFTTLPPAPCPPHLAALDALRTPAERAIVLTARDWATLDAIITWFRDHPDRPPCPTDIVRAAGFPRGHNQTTFHRLALAGFIVLHHTHNTTISLNPAHRAHPATQEDPHA